MNNYSFILKHSLLFNCHLFVINQPFKVDFAIFISAYLNCRYPFVKNCSLIQGFLKLDKFSGYSTCHSQNLKIFYDSFAFNSESRLNEQVDFMRLHIAQAVKLYFIKIYLSCRCIEAFKLYFFDFYLFHSMIHFMVDDILFVN